MVELAFSKWSPGGNITLLFPVRQPALEAACGLGREQANLAIQALDEQKLGGEQAGFVDMAERRLHMAGGEFCVNAARAFGALLALDEAENLSSGTCFEARREEDAAREYHCEARVSGWPGQLHLYVRGKLPCWNVEARLHLPDCPVDKLGSAEYLVRFPGIAHLLLHVDTDNFPDDCMAVAAHMRVRHGLDNFPASGVVWWRRCQGRLEMIPLVHVRQAQTTCLENSCGSGALALALLLSRMEGNNDFSIMQPSGSPLEIRLRKEGGASTATVDGPVTLVARGMVWLDGTAE